MEHALTNSKILRQNSKLIMTGISEYHYHLQSSYDNAMIIIITNNFVFLQQSLKLIMNDGREYYS